MSGALRRFRVMAVVVSVALFVLLLGIVLRYGFDDERLSKTWSPIHGALYIGYLVTVADLSRRVGWSLVRTGRRHAGRDRPGRVVPGGAPRDRAPAGRLRSAPPNLARCQSRSASTSETSRSPTRPSGSAATRRS
jgi:integral membrane protein